MAFPRSVLLALALPGAVLGTAATGSVAPSTREMAALLRERAAAVDPSLTTYIVNDRRADFIGRLLAEPRPPHERFALRFDYALELLNAGRLDQALQSMADLEKDAEQADPARWRRAAPILWGLRAVALLRKGEQDNCNAAHNRNSCLLPIRGQGVHGRPEGSTRAAEVLEQILARDPGNLRARWLLNIAHMTLGEYPQKPARPHLIAPEVFASEHPLPRFTNVAHEVGLSILGLSGGAILDDFDGDDRLDLMVSGIAFDQQLRFFRNGGRNGFEDRTEAAGLTGETGGLNLVQADYDNDGDVDALVLRGGWMGTEGRFPLSLLRNDGGGRFTDVTHQAGLLRFAPTQTATWLDYDGDGRLDLFVGNESSPGAEHPCQLFHNEGDGTFTDRAPQAGVDVIAFVKGVVSGDYDNDGRPDLFLSVGNGANRLFRNDGMVPAPGHWRFTDVAAAAGVTDPVSSFSTFFFDYNNDGWLDIYVSGYKAMAEDVAADYLGLPSSGERPRLFRNRGDGTFEDVTRAARVDRVMRPPWGSISAISTTTASWISTWAPATPTSARWCPIACSATTAAAPSRTSPPRATSATSRRATRSASATWTTMATRTSSRSSAEPTRRTPPTARFSRTRAARMAGWRWSCTASARTGARSGRGSRWSRKGRAAGAFCTAR